MQARLLRATDGSGSGGGVTIRLSRARSGYGIELRSAQNRRQSKVRFSKAIRIKEEWILLVKLETSMNSIELPAGLELRGALSSEHAEILSPETLKFVAQLHREFNPRRLELLAQRKMRQEALDRGEMPDFLHETQSTRDSEWQVAPVSEDLRDRRVEITGPVDRKMVINALNSGANCFMADFEDAHSPTWAGTLEGQVNMRDAIRGTI